MRPGKLRCVAAAHPLPPCSHTTNPPQNQRGSADIIAALPSRLRRLDLSRNAVGVLNACDIARRQARPGGSLEVLELRGCFLCSHGNDARAVHALARALAVGAPLRSLAVDGNCLPKEATLAVAAALRLSRTLVRLSLADNKLWADSAEALGAAAAARCAAGSDVALLLGGCSLRAPEMASLARGTRGPDRRRQRRRRSVSPTVGLRRPPRPGTLGLDLRRNPIGVGAADALRSLLTNAAAPVRALSLAHVPLPAPLLEAICDGIESRSPHLKHLDLDCTALAPLRGTAISSALGAAWAAPGGEGSLPSGRVAAPLLPPLETLSLEACSFGYVGAEAFAALLASVPGHPLKRLNLRRNFVGARGVAALRPVLLADRGLERLVLGRDDLAHPGFGPAALGHGKTVRTRPLAMASRVAVLSSVCCAAADGTQNSLPADVVRGLLDFLDTPVCMSVDDGQHHPA